VTGRAARLTVWRVGVLREKHKEEVETILAKYPPQYQRSAVMPLLYLAQQAHGFLTPEAIEEVGDLLGLTSTEVGSIVGFYTLYHDQPEGRYRIQICTDLPCALKGADQFAGAICANLGIRLGETTDDGLVTVEEVMCLAGCDRAPLFQVQDAEGIHYHENQTVETALQLIRELRKDDTRA
jgi:NADH-quinone oxidoreductase subunit E